MLRNTIRVLALTLALIGAAAGTAAAYPKSYCDSQYQTLYNACAERFSTSTDVQRCRNAAFEWYQGCLDNACDC
ncbi:hypothetical protein [Nocardia sp. BMG51109]|uniref:hypothetical protein n=1 Tax=Nocardia sp. BMG51109 TaxID=1056816 RepID=UPI0004ADAE49|nr:hypothetical protein [Nocardia sp. BMG51109]